MIMSLCHFPYLFTAPLHKFSTSPLKCRTHRQSLAKSFRFACSAEKSRKKGKASRPSRTDEDVCNEIRDFLSVAGLSKDHVPSLKELSDYGRKDLANSVRRRGYKKITEILRNSFEKDIHSDKPSVDQNDNPCCAEASEFQERKLNDSGELGSSSRGSSVGTNGAVATASAVQLCDSSQSSEATLHMKAANFVQTGKLDVFEETSEFNNAEIPNDSQLNPRHISYNDAPDTAYMAPKDAHVSAQCIDRVHTTSDQGLKVADTGELASETVAGSRVSRAEIDHLKAILHKKEMELVELKRQIESEKKALSILQKKANEDIDNAQRMLTKKDMELIAAEERLSGLKEVQIEYWADGKTVEIAGSFNGWHHRVKMDAQPSPNSMNPSISSDTGYIGTSATTFATTSDSVLRLHLTSPLIHDRFEVVLEDELPCPPNQYYANFQANSSGVEFFQVEENYENQKRN